MIRRMTTGWLFSFFFWATITGFLPSFFLFFRVRGEVSLDGAPRGKPEKKGAVDFLLTILIWDFFFPLFFIFFGGVDSVATAFDRR